MNAAERYCRGTAAADVQQACAQGSKYRLIAAGADQKQQH